MNCKVIHVRLQKADHIKIKWIGTCVFIYNTATWPCKTPFIRNVSLCFFSSPDSVYRLCADVQYIYFMTGVLEGEGHQQNGGQIRWRPSLVLKDSNWLRWLPLVVEGSGVQIVPTSQMKDAHSVGCRWLYPYYLQFSSGSLHCGPSNGNREFQFFKIKDLLFAQFWSKSENSSLLRDVY